MRLLGRIHYGWVVVGATFLVVLMAAGIRSMPSVLIVPLEEEFGWSRATISLAVSINLLLFGFGGPFAAAIMERVGMRRMMASALLLIAAALGLTTQMTASWQLQLLWGVLIGVGVGSLSGWMAATVANRWFVTRRGLVVGLLGTGNAMGQLIFLPSLASLVVSLGWRMAAFVVAGLALAAIPIVLIFLRDRPSDMGLRPYGARDGAKPEPLRATGNPFKAALAALSLGVRDRDYRRIAGSFFVCGASANGLIGTHLIPASMDHGMSEVTAAGFLASMGFFSMLGGVLSGYLSDRFDNRKLLGWYYGLRGLSLLFLPFAFELGLYPLILFVVFYGLDWSATGPPTVRLCADKMGRANVGTFYAWALASHQLGAASVAFSAGLLHTILGDYRASFTISGILCLIAVVVVMSIKPGEPEEQRGVPGRALAEAR